VADIAHLSIGEVLSLLQEEFPDVTISKIRFLESQGLLDPERTPSGYRKFYEDDIDRLRWILREQRENFLPLKVIKDRLEEHGGGAPPPSTAASDSDEPSAAPVAVQEQAPRPDETASATLPIWMADAAKHQAVRKAAALTEAQPEASAAQPGPLDSGPTTVSLTRDELAHASGLSLSQLKELEQFGLLRSERIGDDELYDGDCLVVSQKAAALFGHGLSARHLRAFKMAADREAALFQQLVTPLLKQRQPKGRQEALQQLSELTSLSAALQAALLRGALRSHFRPG